MNLRECGARPSLSPSVTMIFKDHIRIDTMNGCSKSFVLEIKEHLLWKRASVLRHHRQLPSSLRLEP
jgi:hypothetical protein